MRSIAQNSSIDANSTMDDNARMTTFDSITIHRDALADAYLAALKAQPGRPIALFAPRRVGKTHFLDGDLAPAAAKAGMLPVYADLWLSRKDPLAAINHALEEALDDVTVPTTAAGKAAKTPVKKVAILGNSLDFGDAPVRRPLPDDPRLRLDSLITRLASASGKQIVLMLDEVQSLAHAPQADDVIGTLRAVLQKHKKLVFSLFTGSSQEELGAMMAVAGAPMYQFAQLQTFPNLGSEYLELLAAHYRKVHPNKRLDLAALERMFAHVGWKPALMKDLVKAMSADGITDVNQGLTLYLADERNVAAWQGMFDRLLPLEQAVAVLVAHGIAPMAKATTDALAKEPGLASTQPKVRSAVDRLRKAQILAKPEHGGSFHLEDQLFADYLAQKYTPHYLAKVRPTIAAPTNAPKQLGNKLPTAK